MTLETLKDILSKAPDTTITVLGDFCLDEYLYIDSKLDEPSLETGLTAYQVVGKKCYPGGAGAVTNNLCALGARVQCAGVIGNDGSSFELLRALEKIGASCDYLLRDSERVTPTYMKPMRSGNTGYTEMSRLDMKNFSPMSQLTEKKLIENIRKCAASSRALVVIDQFIEPDCGTVNSRVREAIRQIALENPELTVFADSRAFINLFSDMIVKCNNFEAVKTVLPGFDGECDSEIVSKCASSLAEKNGRPVFVTQGAHGITVYDDSGLHFAPAYKVDGEVDICGAGDSASSGIVLALACGASPANAAAMGNIVASVTIRQIGVTGCSTPEQAIDAFINGVH